jgi:hypothetical protein
MKKLLLIILVLLSITAFEDSAEQRLINIGKDIIEHPEKIYNLKNNFPECYKDEYIAKEIKDTNLLKLYYNYIDSLFHRNIDTLLNGTNPNQKIEVKKVDKGEFEYFYRNKVNKEIWDRIELYNINFWKDKHYGFCVCFIKDEGKYYLFELYNFYIQSM